MMKGSDWISVYSTQNMLEAITVKSRLETINVDSVILNQQDSAYISIGEIEVWVKREQVIKAINCIRKYENE